MERPLEEMLPMVKRTPLSLILMENGLLMVNLLT